MGQSKQHRERLRGRCARRFDLELYPTLVGGADPKGPVTDEAFTR